MQSRQPGVGRLDCSTNQTPCTRLVQVLQLSAKFPRRLVHATKANLHSLPVGSEPTLLVMNAEADLPPSERSAEAINMVRGELVMPNVTAMTALDLLTRVRQRVPDTNPFADLWSRQ